MRMSRIWTHFLECSSPTKPSTPTEPPFPIITRLGARARALSLSYTHTQDIDGCLVGGASLDAEKFTRIMNFQ